MPDFTRINDSEAPAWLLSRTVRDSDECWHWTGPRLRRYGASGGDRAMVKRDGRARTTARTLWEELRGELPTTLVVRHSCDNAMCARPEHLLTGTHKQNTHDALLRGRLRPGGRAHAA